MNILVLAAGYATRLYPLTLNKAKPLLDVAGKPMLEWVLDNLAPIPDIGTVYIVTNNKFAADFQAWADGYNAQGAKLQFKIVNDGSTNDKDKLGAIGDINLVVNKESLDKDGLLVVAGDNLFSESLEKFAEFAKGTEATLATYDVGDLEQIKKYNNLTLDAEGRITAFEEKPAHAHQHEHRHRAVLLRGVHGEDVRRLHQGRQQPRPAGPLHPMALPAPGCPHLSDPWHLVRHRQQGNAGGSEQDLRQICPVTLAAPILRASFPARR